MPRSLSSDYLMTHRFHLVDVSLSVPPVLLPIFGFSSITAPELSLNHREIREANNEYPRKVFESAAVNTITCARGAQLQDTDFWAWADGYVKGVRPKKNLMLIQFTGVAPQGLGTNDTQVLGQQAAFDFPSLAEYGTTFPGRAWILRNCSPGRYKTASDFDASQGAVSIMELDIVYEFFIDFNTGF